MTVIDNDANGTPDGIINLYDEYFNVTGENIQPGVWSDPNFNFVLDPNTGDVNLWDLTESSVVDTNYTFVLNNADCGNSPALTINLVLGPFSGFALPPVGVNSVNVQVCNTGNVCIDIESYDLFGGLQSDPSPHLNGTWIYEGSSPNFIRIEGSELYVNVPYDSGPPLVDEETFALVYVVPGISPCSPEQRTTVNVSVVRQVSSGEATLTRICEADILSGNYDADIDLTNDAFLIGEDIEGVWSGGPETNGQISTPLDAMVNIRALYDDMVATNPRFGFRKFDFRYDVEQRSAVCSDVSTDVPIVIYEMLRPFQQPSNRIICLDDNQITSLDLFDELEFTTESGVLYEYNRNECTNWEFVSGPSDLGVKSHSAGICATDPQYTPQGTVDLTNAQTGTYIFRYTVDPHYNCNGANCSNFQFDSSSCPENFSSPNHTCSQETALVTLVLTEKLYAGENTENIELCADENPIDLISLLDVINSQTIYRGANGVWTDENDVVIPNDFIAPAITDQQTFNFKYTTTDSGTCIDEATLSFTLYEQYKAGEGAVSEFCSDASIINLYDLLTGEKGEQGTWAGPEGYSATYLGEFDPNILVSGSYVYTVPANGPCPADTATVSITVDPLPNAGEDFSSLACTSDGAVNLLDLLDSDVDMDGAFYVNGSTTPVPNNNLDISNESTGTLSITYTVDRNDNCTADSATITLSIVNVIVPTAESQTFCVLEGPTVADLEANTLVDFGWYADVESDVTLPFDEVLQTKSYFISNFSDTGCESERVEVNVRILNIGESSDCKPEMQDGVSPNNDSRNDVFNIEDLVVAFPNFELSIYNRYGTKVYTGKSGTSFFSGLSNIKPSFGDDLPSGVYFYVFEPNDSINKPFQGSFYLSK